MPTDVEPGPGRMQGELRLPAEVPVSSYGLAAVSSRYFQGLRARPSQLRADRLLTAAADSGSDPLSLVWLFGVSDDTAVRYCTGLDRAERDPAVHQAGR